MVESWKLTTDTLCDEIERRIADIGSVGTGEVIIEAAIWVVLPPSRRYKIEGMIIGSGGGVHLRLI